MTKRAAAANAKDRMKAVTDELPTSSEEDEVSSVDLDSESDSDVSSGEETVSSDAKEESESEDDVEIQSRKVSSPVKSQARSQDVGFLDFENYTIVRDANEEIGKDYVSEVIIKTDNWSGIVNSSVKGAKSTIDKVKRGQSTPISYQIQGFLEKYVQKWIQTSEFKAIGDDGIYFLDICRTRDKFSCPFSACSKEFANYNGLNYHLTKANHSFLSWWDEIKDLLEENDKTYFDELMDSNSWPIKTKGMLIRYEGRKKIDELEIGFDEKGETPSSGPRKAENKQEMIIFPEKSIIQNRMDRFTNSVACKKGYSVVSENDAQVFFPEQSNLNIKIGKSFHSLQLFESYSQDQALKKGSKRNYRNRWILNTGIAVLALDYCPRPKNAPHQYLAVGGYKNTHENQILGQPQFEDFPDDPRMAQMIQIWEVSTKAQPKLVLGIAHRYGCVYDLKWYPFVDSSGDRLGILAASFGDGSCRVFSVPNPHSLNTVGEQVIIVSCESIFEVALPGALLWKLCWVGSDTLVNGTTDGRVVVWNTKPYFEGETSIEPGKLNYAEGEEPISIYYAHDCAIRKIEGCVLSDLFFISSGNDGRFLVHDIRQSSPAGQLHRGVTIMTAICWSGRRMVCADREHYLRLCQIEEGSTMPETGLTDANTSVYAQIKTIGVMRHQSTVWDCDGSPYTPFIASSSSSLVIGNVNRSKRHYSPVTLCLYSLAYDNVKDVLEFQDREEIPEKPVSQIPTVWQLSQPEVSIHKVCWNKNPGHEFDIASAGRLGFVRLESCLKS